MKRLSVKYKHIYAAALLFTVMFVICISGTTGISVSAQDYTYVDNLRYYYFPSDLTGFKPEGTVNYILTDTLSFSETIKITSGTVTIDLNGNEINGENLKGGDPIIEVSGGASLKITDHTGSGYIDCNSGGAAIVLLSGNLTVKDVDICDNLTGIQSYSGSISLEGGSSVQWHDTGIIANNTEISISGQSEISGNKTGILLDGTNAYFEKPLASKLTIGGSASLKNNIIAIDVNDGSAVSITDSTIISGNRTGVRLSAESKLELSGCTVIDNNSEAGVAVCNKQLVYAETDEKNAGTFHVQFSVYDTDSETGELFIGYSAERQFCQGELDVQPGYTAVRRIDSSLTGNYIKISVAGCSTHDYEYEVYDTSIKAKCRECYEYSTAKFTLADYDAYDDHAYYEGSDISEKIKITELSWDTSCAPYPVIVYGSFDRESGEESYSTEVPSKAGVYAVKLAVLADPNDVTSEYASTPEHIFAIIPCNVSCPHDSLAYYTEYFSENGDISVRCDDCGKLIAKAKISAVNGELSEYSTDDRIIIMGECVNDKFIMDCDGDEELFEDIVLVYGYYQKDGSLKYSLKVPTEHAVFTVHLAYLGDNNIPADTSLSTDDIKFEIRFHHWIYSSDETAIYAGCCKCGEKASVRLERAGADYATRHYDEDAEEECFEYDIFVQENWKDQKGIEQYYVLYDGLAVEDEFNTTLKSNVFYKPTVSGSYTAKLVLLENTANPESCYISTGKISYYLAGVSLGNPYLKIVDYSSEQLAALKAPEFIDNAYQVGTFEELMWVAENCTGNENINITSDIVANPITVSDDGKTVRCGSFVIYKWHGIGYSLSGGYCGNIYGNGHTVYGLYAKGSDYAGLIINGHNNLVENLTVSDSVFYAVYRAGGIASEIYGDASKSGKAEPAIKNCSVLNCIISQSSGTGASCGAGGITGAYIEVMGMSKLTIEYCLIDSYVKGSCAGGLIGGVYRETCFNDGNEIYLSHCVNLGKIYGIGTSAGGLAGQFDGSQYDSISIVCCGNAGVIDGDGSAVLGGLAGDWQGSDEDSIFSHNINVGRINNENEITGGLIGRLKHGLFYEISDNMYYGSDKAVGKTVDSKISCDFSSETKLLKNEAVLSLLCSCTGNSFHCIENSEWSLTVAGDCENDGELSKLCPVCREVLDTREIEAHGHNYEYGKCVYCLKEENEGILASVFSKAGKGLYIMAALLLAGSAAAIIFGKKKKHRAE